MNNAWNLWDIKPPPVCTVKTVLHIKEITGLNEVILNALNALKDQNHLHREAAILSRLLYKNRRIFRHDKGMHNLVKVNQCLKRYLKLNMSGVLLTFKQSLPFKFNPAATHAYLPTKQMLMWVLLKLQAFSQIFVRLINLSKEVGAYFFQKLCLGQALTFSIMIYSISSRILGTSKYLVKKSIEWYSSLYRVLPFLQHTSDFLLDYTLPSNLKLWLGSVDLSPLKKKTFIDGIFEFIDLAESDEEEDDDKSHLKIVPENMKSFFKVGVPETDSVVEEVFVEESKKKGAKRPLDTSRYEDLGVPVNTEENVLERPRKKEKKNKGQKKQLV